MNEEQNIEDEQLATGNKQLRIGLSLIFCFFCIKAKEKEEIL